MNFFQNYINYLKDNPEHYWFKRKLYGYGWTPATREGWFVVLGYVLILILLVSRLERSVENNEPPILFFILFTVTTLILIYVSYRMGEPPKWQFGLPKADGDTPDEPVEGQTIVK